MRGEGLEEAGRIFSGPKLYEIQSNLIEGRDAMLNSFVCIGASGALYGLLIAFAILFPNEALYIMFIPIPIKAKYLVPAIAAYDLFSGVAGFEGDNVAHFAHLGGLVVGFILVMMWRSGRPWERR